MFSVTCEVFSEVFGVTCKVFNEVFGVTYEVFGVTRCVSSEFMTCIVQCRLM